MIRQLLTLASLSICALAHAHTEMFFSVMQVQRSLRVSTSTLQIRYDCRIADPIPEAAKGVIDLDANNSIETSETKRFWNGAMEYLEADMVVYAGRDQVKIRRGEFTPTVDGKSCILALEASLPKTNDDIHVTLVDPAFLFPPLTGPATYPATRAIATAPSALVVEGNTTNSLELESSPAAVFVVRPGPTSP